MSFSVGQKVVCVDIKPRMYPTCDGLIIGEIYTVEHMDFGGVAVLLVEVKSKQNPLGYYYADRFRPLIHSLEEVDNLLEEVKKIAEKEIKTV